MPLRSVVVISRQTSITANLHKIIISFDTSRLTRPHEARILESYLNLSGTSRVEEFSNVVRMWWPFDKVLCVEPPSRYD